MAPTQAEEAIEKGCIEMPRPVTPVVSDSDAKLIAAFFIVGGLVMLAWNVVLGAFMIVFGILGRLIARSLPQAAP